MIATDFQLPKYVKVESGSTERYSRFVIEPFERGYGTTIGNSLRRVLLASLTGAAVTAVRVEGINHEFSAIPGVKEDMTDVVLNLKQCQLRLKEEKSVIFSHSFKGQGELTAGALFKGQEHIECFNPDLIILNSVNKTTKLDMEVKVASGRGYITAENFEFEHAPLGTIYLDAAFSPVTKVNFLVEDARVGQHTDYDKLVLEVWTTGAVTPEVALEQAADIIIQHLKIFSATPVDEAAASGAGVDEDPELTRKLDRSVDELELSVRSANCLKAANIRSIRDLVSYSEGEMLGFQNFGKKSLDEINAILETMGLRLGMGASGNKTSGNGQEALAAVDADLTEDEDDDD